jgi:hypothetical protein
MFGVQRGEGVVHTLGKENVFFPVRNRRAYTHVARSKSLELLNESGVSVDTNPSPAGLIESKGVGIPHRMVTADVNVKAGLTS